MTTPKETPARAPREFLYVGRFVSTSEGIYSIIDPLPDFQDKTWLVEKAEYQRVVKELAECKEERLDALDRLRTAEQLLRERADVTKERDRLREELAAVHSLCSELAEALKEIAKNNTDERSIYTMGCDCDQVAREALAKWEAFNGES